MDENTTIKKRTGRPKGAKDLVPRKKRTDGGGLAKLHNPDVEPGDNSKYLRHALATYNLPPIDIADPAQVEERIGWYFNHCFDNDMKPTVTGFCNSLGVTKETVRNWYSGTYREDSHQAIIRQAYAVLEEMWENYMQNGKINPVAGIFLGKNNFNYSDKQEYVLTPNQQQIDPADVATIEAKYAELPDIEG